MKKIYILLILIVLIGGIGFIAYNELFIIKDGTYILSSDDVELDMNLPYINIANNEITFCYDPLSSYLPVGTYMIKDNLLMMETSDKKYNYVFLRKGKTLVFQENLSSELVYTSKSIGNAIVNNAEFKVK